LLVEEEEAQINALCSIQVQDCPKIALGILHMPIPRPGFLQEIQNVHRRLIFKTLVLDYQFANEALHSSFTLCLENMKHANITNITKNKF
jgi:hypothetical protein